jgi:membrane protein involved in colicin uptake
VQNILDAAKQRKEAHEAEQERLRIEAEENLRIMEQQRAKEAEEKRKLEEKLKKQQEEKAKLAAELKKKQEEEAQKIREEEEKQRKLENASDSEILFYAIPKIKNLIEEIGTPKGENGKKVKEQVVAYLQKLAVYIEQEATKLKK